MFVFLVPRRKKMLLMQLLILLIVRILNDLSLRFSPDNTMQAYF